MDSGMLFAASGQSFPIQTYVARVVDMVCRPIYRALTPRGDFFCRLAGQCARQEKCHYLLAPKVNSIADQDANIG